MKISAEIREGNRITTFSADLAEAEKALKSAADKFEGFIKKTFKVESFEKKEQSK